MANTVAVTNFSSASTFQGTVTQNMLPALVQCFGIIILGYIFGRTKLLDERETKGLSLFVQYLALPSLIFTSLATISFSNVKWQFIAAVLVSKIVIFLAVAIGTLIMTRPVHLGKAGIYAIAATQSNDLALGYPLMVSLYKISHPTFPTILYIIVPIQLLVLNPVGFFLLEAYKRRTEAQYSQEHSLCHIITGTIKNPIIVATLAGIIWNFSFNQHVPIVMNQLLEALSTVFSPLALFLLGHSMSSGVKAVKGYFSLTPSVIVLMKIFALPLLLQRITEYFLITGTEAEIRDFSSLGFLYGTIPGAPTVFIFAKQYDVSVNAIASVTVYSTLFSAPLMLTSATMISLAQYSFQNITLYLKETISYISAINLSCCIFIFVILMIKKKWRDVCCIPVLYIIGAQTVMSVGGIFFFFDYEERLSNLQYILSISGLFLTRFFAVFLVVVIFLLQWKSLCFVLRHKNCINGYLGFTIPLCAAQVLAFNLVQSQSDKSWNPDFQFSYTEVVTVLSMTVLTLTCTITFLVFQHRFMKTNTFNENLQSVPKILNASQQPLSYNECSSNMSCKRVNCDSDINSMPSTSYRPPSDIEDVAHEFEEIKCSVQEETSHQKRFFKHTCDSQHSCNIERRLECTSQIENYKQNVSPQDMENDQYVRYIILLLSLSSSMLISIMICASWLVAKAPSGIRVELQFLDIILNYGQGILCFILFGFDTKQLGIIFHRCRQRRRSNHSEVQSDEERLITET